MSGVNRLGLKFNKNQMITDLVVHLVQAVDNTAMLIAGEMRTKARSERVSNSIQKEVFALGMEKIIAHIGSDHWMAFLDNYGTGLKMSDNNPYLSEYMSGQHWNSPYRTGKQVVGRPPGDYVSPNYSGGDGVVTKTSAGAFFDSKENKALPLSEHGDIKFVSKTPSHFLESAMAKAEALLDAELDNAFYSFQWDSDKYLKGGAQ